MESGETPVGGSGTASGSIEADAERILAGLASVYFPPNAEGIEQLLADLPGLRHKNGPKPEGPDAETRYRTLVEQIPAVVFVALLGEASGEAYVSPHIERTLGFTQEEWLEDPVRWYSQIHPEDRGRWSAEAADLFLTGHPLRSIYRVLARDGRVVWFNCEAKMVRNSAGHPWFIHGVGFDITDLKHVEEALRKSRDELEIRVRQRTAELQLEIAARKRTELELMRSNEDLQQFAWSASHDLQEPIRNVSVYSELLRRQYKGRIDAEADFFLDNIAEGALRMGALVRDLLAFAQVSGTVDEDVEEIEADFVLARVVENLAAVIDENRACINSHALPRVRMREVHLQQIFQNLISNAIKYRSGETPRIDISAQPGDSEGDHLFALFTVRDNGAGIEPQYHERIFGLFKRLHRHGNHPGTGLGLAICKRTVERYRGRIWVESQPGKGSAFFFTLPAAAASSLEE